MSKAVAGTIRMLWSALDFVRPKIIITCCIIAFIGAISSGKPTADLGVVLCILISWYIHAASANDYADRNIDAVNLVGAKNRPLLGQRVTVRELWIIHALGGVISILLSLHFGLLGLVLIVGVLSLDYMYSFRPFYLAGRGIISQLSLPLAYVLVPFTFGYLSTQTPLTYNWVLMLGIYFGFTARLFLKDFRDTKGDAQYGKRTFLLRHGVTLTCITSGVFALISFALITISLDDNFGVIFTLLLLHAVALILLTELMDVPKNQKLMIISVLAKIGNASAVIILLHYTAVQYRPQNTFLTDFMPAIIGITLLIHTARSAGLWLPFSSASFFQHLVWIPVRIFMHTCCAVRIKGIEHVKNINGNAIIASNHVSELDPLFIVSSLPFFSRQLPTMYVVREKSYYSQHWKGIRKAIYGGSFFEMIGGYEAYRGLQNYEKSLTHHLRALREGQSVTIFPVGRWHTANEYVEARGGVAFLAANTNTPIIPIHIQGIDSRLTLKDYLRRTPKLTITFGAAIHAHDIFDKPLDQIASDDRQSFEKAAVKLMKIVSELT